jgi:para-nitrobenzyl esterase
MLAERMSNMIVSFARTGVPSPDWTTFAPTKPKMMMLGEDVRIIDWPNYKALDLLRPAALPTPSAAVRPRD